MDFKHFYYPECKFGGFTDIDGTIAFYIRVNSLIKPSFDVLDFGCGRGAYGEDPVSIRKELRIFKGRVHKVVGIDPDKSAESNPYIDEFYFLKSDAQWPLDDDSIDLCICDSVLEHIKRAECFFSESRRVLKDGGYLCIRTPNLWNYAYWASKIIPNRFHTKILNKVQKGRKEQDIFPTYYGCNTMPKIKAMLNKFDFEHVVYAYEPEPAYSSFSKIAYWAGVMHQKFSPMFLHPIIFAYAM